MNQLVTIEPEKYWFSVLPSGWNIGRIKDVYNQVSNTGSKLDEGAYIPLENLESFTGKLIQRVNNENNETTNLFRKGDILLNKLRPYLAKVHLAEFNGGVSGEVVVLRNSTIWKRNTSNKYFFYRFLSSAFINKINSMSEGVKMPRTNPSKILALEIAIPSVEEQTAIANYLDTKTQAIDNKVSLLEKKIGYYLELRKSLVNETVTKGLDKNVKLKDSGIDWIGQIPEHWEVKRFKSFASTTKGKNLETSDFPFDNALPILSLEYLRNENVKFDTYAYSPDKTLLASYKDLIIVWDGAAVGEILKAKKGFISSTIAKINFTKSISSRFFYFLKDSLDYTLKSIPTGMGIPHLNPTILSNYPCPIPPLQEQIKIAEFLENKVGLIEKIITNIQTQITTLKELRKTLINDVVTGKIKVSHE